MESFVSIKKTQMRASLLHAFLKVLTVRGFPSPWQFQLITHWTRWCCQATTTNPRLSAMIFPKVRVSSLNFCFLSMDVAWEWVWLLGLRFGPTKGNVSYKSSVCFRGPTLFHVPWDGSKVFSAHEEARAYYPTRVWMGYHQGGYHLLEALVGQGVSSQRKRPRDGLLMEFPFEGWLTWIGKDRCLRQYQCPRYVCWKDLCQPKFPYLLRHYA